MAALRWILLLIILSGFLSCQHQNQETFTLKGNWQFLDKRGLYNETLFEDSTFFTYRQHTGFSPVFEYHIKADSFYANVDRRKEGKIPIAQITLMEDGRIMLTTEFVRDTLQRIPENEYTLSHLLIEQDTSKYEARFQARLENFLIEKGITTREEIDDFKNNGKLPKDLAN